MSLPALPDLVLDNILQRLDLQSHLSLSSTCRSLHIPANRHLFGYIDYDKKWIVSQTTSLDHCLHLNPANAQFLRDYSVISIDGIKRLWTNTPPRLQRLSITYYEYNIVTNESWNNLISSIPPEMLIPEWKLAGGLVIESGRVLLSRLSALQGLVRLELNLDDSTIDLQGLLDQLDCPQLTDITLNTSTKNWHVLPNNNLPNLQSLQLLLYEEKSLRCIMEPTTWTYLKAMMIKGIFFKVKRQSWPDGVLSFFRTVHMFASAEEIHSVLLWLIQGERHFQRRNDIYAVDIRDLPPTRRNLTLQAAQDLPQHGFRISIYASDSKHSGGIFPNTTSHLDLFVQENISPNFIPILIRSTRALRSLIVNVCALRSISTTFPSHTCTHAHYSFPESAKDHVVSSFDFSFSRGGEVLWRDRYMQRPYKQIPEKFKTGISQLCTEVKGWFNLNATLKRIGFNVWDPYMWSHIVNADDFSGDAYFPDSDSDF